MSHDGPSPQRAKRSAHVAKREYNTLHASMQHRAEVQPQLFDGVPGFADRVSSYRATTIIMITQETL